MYLIIQHNKTLTMMMAMIMIIDHFRPVVAGEIFFVNVGDHLQKYTVLQPERPRSTTKIMLVLVTITNNNNVENNNGRPINCDHAIRYMVKKLSRCAP
jgi:hypothetical protein